MRTTLFPFAVITGSNLGINHSSKHIAQINAHKPLGQTGVNVYVNAATGNLYLEDQHKSIQFLGFNIEFGFVYNSKTTDESAWHNRCVKELQLKQQHSFNEKGSQLDLVEGDGSITTFNYDEITKRYIATNSITGNHTIEYKAGIFTASYAGTTLQEEFEVFAKHNTMDQFWRVKRRIDTTGSTDQTHTRMLTFNYKEDGRITNIIGSDSQHIDWEYNDQNKTIGVYVTTVDQPKNLMCTYQLDAADRLIKTTIPQTENVFEINYAYINNQANLLQSITHTGDVTLNFISDEQQRIKTILDGNQHAFQIYYQSKHATVTDALGNTLTVGMDAQQRLTGIGRTSSVNAIEITTIAFDGAAEQPQCVLHPDNSYETYTYDSRWGLINSHKIYAANKTLLAQTDLTYDANGDIATKAVTSIGENRSLITHYIYNGKRQLVCSVSPLKAVTCHDYDPHTGTLISTRTYLASKYLSNDFSGAALATWCVAQDQTQVHLVDYTNNIRGQVIETWHYTQVDAQGKGNLAAAKITTKVWDIFNNLLMHGEQDTANQRVAHLRYFDPLQRLIDDIDAQGDKTHADYQDAKKQQTTEEPNGLIRTVHWDTAGFKFQIEEYPKDNPSKKRITTYTPDPVNRLFVINSPDNQLHYLLHDAQGRPEFIINALGSVKQMSYDALGREATTICYGTPIDMSAINADHTDIPRFYKAMCAAVQNIQEDSNQNHHLQDRRTDKLYDALGNLTYEVDGEGGVKKYVWDSRNNKIRVVEFAAKITIKPAIYLREELRKQLDELQVIAATDSDVRYYYDDDNHLIGQHEAGEINPTDAKNALGYYTQFIRDAGGNLLQEIKLKNPSSLASGFQGAATANSNPSDRINHFYFRNAAGKLMAEVDGVNRFTWYDYYDNGLIKTKYVYTALVVGIINPPDFSTKEGLSKYLAQAIALRDSKIGIKTDPEDRITVYEYDALKRETKCYEKPLNKLTRTLHDSNGNKLLETSLDLNDNAIEHHTKLYRYNAWNQVADELNERVCALKHDDPTQDISVSDLINLSDDELATKIKLYWALHENQALHYSYDNSGLKISTTDLLGNITLHFYNENREEIFTVNAVGSITAKTRNAFSEVESNCDYATQMDANRLNELQKEAANPAYYSGIISAVLRSEFAQLHDQAPEKNRETKYTFNHCGKDIDTVDPDGYHHIKNLDGRSQCSLEKIQITLGEDNKPAQYLTNTATYDPRGLITEKVKDAEGAKITVANKFNVHAKVNEHTDERGNKHVWQHDNVGREVEYIDPTPVKHANEVSYDNSPLQLFSDQRKSVKKTWTAHDQVATITNRNNKTSKNTHQGRNLTETSPSGRQVITSTDAFGLPTAITTSPNTAAESKITLQRDAAGVVSLLTEQISADTSADRVTQDEHDLLGNHIAHQEPNGLITSYDPNAVGLIEKQIDDLKTKQNPSGANIQTRFVHNAFGDEQKKTAATGIITQDTYNRRRLLVDQVIDPQNADNKNGLNLADITDYDGLRRKISIKKGNLETPNQYNETISYPDPLGLTTIHTVDLGTIDKQKIVTEQRCDKANNIVFKRDSNGNVTRHVFNVLNQKVFTIDAMGVVTRFEPDAEGLILAKRIYANALPADKAAALGDEPTIEAVEQAISASALANKALDRTQYQRFNDDGQLVYRVTGLGQITQFLRDAAGRQIGERQFAFLPQGAALKDFLAIFMAIGSLNFQAFDAFLATKANAVKDQITYSIGNKKGEERFSVDAEGYVIQSDLNQAGQVVAVTKYAQQLDISSINSNTTVEDMLALLAAYQHDVENRKNYTIYDALKRKVCEIDAKGYVTTYIYYADQSRVQQEHKYGNPIIVPAVAPLTLDAIKQLLPAKPDPKVDGVNKYTYDNFGRVLSIEYCLENTEGLNQKESFTYQGINTQWKTFTDKAGQLWQREYDAAGRLKLEKTPLIDLVIVTKNVDGQLETNPKPIAACIISEFEYDSNGNKKAVTKYPEGYKAVAIQRMEYSFNARNSAIMSTIKHASVDDLSLDYPATPDIRPDKLTDIPTSIIYDSRQRPIAIQNEAEKWQFILRDSEGNPRVTIDEVGGIAVATFNAFNKPETIRHYCNKPKNYNTKNYLQTIAGMTVEDFLRADNLPEDNSNDRLETIQYDRCNNETMRTQAPVLTCNLDEGVERWQMSQPTSIKMYNAFGENTGTKVLADSKHNSYIENYVWYDARGQKIAEIDSERYITIYENENFHSKCTYKIEYAHPLSDALDISRLSFIQLKTAAEKIKTPQERIYRNKYDILGQLYQADRENITIQVAHTIKDKDGNFVENKLEDLAIQTISTVYRRDALGRETSTHQTLTQLNGEKLTTTREKCYNAFNKVILERGAERHTQDDANKDIVYREIKAYGYSPFSQRASVTRYAEMYAPTDPNKTITSTEKKLTQLIQHDMARNLAIAVQEGTSVRYLSYSKSAASKNSKPIPARQWAWVTQPKGKPRLEQKRIWLNELAQVMQESILNYAKDGTTKKEQKTAWQYNPFHECIAEGDPDNVQNPWAVYWHFNRAGILWATNEDKGIPKLFGYDAAKRKVFIGTSMTQNLATISNDFQLLTALKWDYKKLQTLKLQRNKQGYVYKQYLPKFKRIISRDPNTQAPEPIRTVFAVGDTACVLNKEDVKEFGKFTLSWIAPVEKYLKAKIELINKVTNECIVRVPERKTATNGADYFVVDTSMQLDVQVKYVNILVKFDALYKEWLQKCTAPSVLLIYNSAENCNKLYYMKNETRQVTEGKLDLAALFAANNTLKSATKYNIHEICAIVGGSILFVTLLLNANEAIFIYPKNNDEYTSCYEEWYKQAMLQNNSSDALIIFSPSEQKWKAFVVTKGQLKDFSMNADPLVIASAFLFANNKMQLKQFLTANSSFKYEPEEVAAGEYTYHLSYYNNSPDDPQDKDDKLWAYVAGDIVLDTGVSAYTGPITLLQQDNSTIIFTGNTMFADGSPLFKVRLHSDNGLPDKEVYVVADPTVPGRYTLDLAEEELGSYTFQLIYGNKTYPIEGATVGPYNIITAKQTTKRLCVQEIFSAMELHYGYHRYKDKWIYFDSNMHVNANKPYNKTLMDFIFYKNNGETYLSGQIIDGKYAYNYQLVDADFDRQGLPSIISANRLSFRTQLSNEWVPLFNGNPYACKRIAGDLGTENSNYLVYCNYSASVLCITNLPDGVENVVVQYEDPENPDKWLDFVDIALSDKKHAVSINTAQCAAGIYNYRLQAHGNNNAIIDLKAIADVKDNWAVGKIAITKGQGNQFTPAKQPDNTELVAGIIQQTPDRWGNALTTIDIFGHTTNRTFNHDSKLLTEEKPEVTVTNENGDSIQIKPRIKLGYNEQGGTVGKQDENQHITVHGRNAANEVTATTLADGTSKKIIADEYGRARRIVDDEGHELKQLFDDWDTLLQSIAPPGNNTDKNWITHYLIDEFHRNIGVTNPANETHYYGYNSPYFARGGSIDRSYWPIEKYGFIWNEYDRNQQVLLVDDGTPDKKLTGKDPQPLIYKRDYWGNVLWYINKAGTTTTYDLNFNQQIIQQKSAGGNRPDAYGLDGKLNRVLDQDIIILRDEVGHETDRLNNGAGSTMRYYLRPDGEREGNKFIGKDGTVHQDIRAEFDACDRLTRIYDAQWQGSYGYDAKGNRRFTRAYYWQEEAYQPTNYETWNTYNAADLLLIQRGQLLPDPATQDKTKKIQATKDQGIVLEYDKAMRRNKETRIDASCNPVVTEIDYYANDLLKSQTTGNSSKSYQYDKASRRSEWSSQTKVKNEGWWARIFGPTSWKVQELHTTEFNANDWLARQVSQKDKTITEASFYDFDNAGFSHTQHTHTTVPGDDDHEDDWVDDMMTNKFVMTDSEEMSQVDDIRTRKDGQFPLSGGVFKTFDADLNVATVEGILTDGFRAFVTNADNKIVVKSDGLGANSGKRNKKENYFYTPNSELLGRAGDLKEEDYLQAAVTPLILSTNVISSAACYFPAPTKRWFDIRPAARLKDQDGSHVRYPYAGFQLLEASRFEVVDYLLDLNNNSMGLNSDADARVYLSNEIAQAFISGRLAPRDETERQLIRNYLVSEKAVAESNDQFALLWAHAKLKKFVVVTNNELLAYCATSSIYNYYMQHLAKKGELGYRSACLYGKAANVHIQVWQQDPTDSKQLKLIESHKPEQPTREVHLLLPSTVKPNTDYINFDGLYSLPGLVIQVTKKDNTVSYEEKPADIDFDLTEKTVSEKWPQATPQQMAAIPGMTFAQIAQAMYGDSTLGTLLALQNGGSSGRDQPPAGMLIKAAPLTKAFVHNWSGIYGLYNANDIIGSLYPDALQTPPRKPPEHEFWKTFLETFTAVTITVLLNFIPGVGQLAAAVTFQAFLAYIAVEASIAAIANIAQQAVGLADGNLKSFSFKTMLDAVATAAETAGISKGLGITNLASPQTLGQFVEREALTQIDAAAVNLTRLLTGQTNKFDLRALAGAMLNDIATVGSQKLFGTEIGSDGKPLNPNVTQGQQAGSSTAIAIENDILQAAVYQQMDVAGFLGAAAGVGLGNMLGMKLGQLMQPKEAASDPHSEQHKAIYKQVDAKTKELLHQNQQWFAKYADELSGGGDGAFGLSLDDKDGLRDKYIVGGLGNQIDSQKTSVAPEVQKQQEQSNVHRQNQNSYAQYRQQRPNQSGLLSTQGLFRSFSPVLSAYASTNAVGHILENGIDIVEWAHNGLSLGALAAGIREYSNVIGGSWIGKNGKLYDLSWGGNRSTGARSLAIEAAETAKAFGKMIFKFDAALEVIKTAYEVSQGELLTAEKSVLDIGMAGVGLLGPVGLGLSATYSLVDVTIGWDNITHSFTELDANERATSGIGLWRVPN